MKKKVCEALEELRKVLKRYPEDVYAQVPLAELEILVAWADKRSAKSEVIKVGDTVELVADIEYMYGTLRKGEKGEVTRTDVYDPYDLEVLLESRVYYEGKLSFKLSEVRKVAA